MSPEALAGYREAERRIRECHEGQGIELDLSKLGLTEVPPELMKIEALERLDLSGNALKRLPLRLSRLKFLVALDASNNILESLPVELRELKWLQFLRLQRNHLAELPPELGQITSLRYLNLCRNRLTWLPVGIGGLSSLEWLLLWDNQLANLPKELGRMTSLTHLYLHNNQLAKIPREIGRLGLLKVLFLSYNKLTTVPAELGNLKLLDVLTLAFNHLGELPSEIGQLKRLENLWLSNNELTRLPIELRECKALKHLFLHENPDLLIPPWILGPPSRECNGYGGKLDPASPKDILDYYFNIRDGKGRALREVKVILVGRGEVGKTTMVDRLQKKRFVKNRERTDGIAITPWEVTLPDGRAELSFWDFGGQEIMHGTHQFFMTHRSLYVVMVDGRHDRGPQDAEMWLKLVRAFGGDSPVLVVMNRQKTHRFDVDRQALSQKYGVKLEHFFTTECSDEKTVKPLREAVLTLATEMLQAEDLFPAACWEIKERLAQMKEKGENYFSDDEYQKICAHHGMEEEEAQKKLLRRLADLGTVVSFPEDVRLADLSVLNPEWATDGIYRVITDDALRLKGDGVITQKKLRDLLPKDRWPKPKHVQYVVDLMKKFELCFPVEHDGKVLIPELLPDRTPPLGDWRPGECLVYQYQYTVLPRFITRTHQMSEGRQRWRSGVVLSHSEAEARIQADYDANVLAIWVRGKHADARRELLAIVRHHFDSIHAVIKGLNPQDRVAVPGHPKVLVRYRDLVLDERDGKRAYTVTLHEGTDDERRVDWPILDLLNGVQSREERDREALNEMGGPGGGGGVYIHMQPGSILDQSTTIEGNAENCQVAQHIRKSENQVKKRGLG